MLKRGLREAVILEKNAIEDFLRITEEKIQKLQQELKGYPKGKISCLRNGKYVKWYHVMGGKRKYIPKSEIEFAEQLVRKQNIQAKLEDALMDKKALGKYMKAVNGYESKEELFYKNPFYSEILRDTKKHNVDIDTWMNADYSRNPLHPEMLKFESISGNILRSKSELIIDQLLFVYQIPYRYECKLVIGDVTLYPDFTIIHPKTGKMFYWEHFGMMDNQKYSQKAFSKLEIYCENGIIPSINLITTFETTDFPLDAVKVENIIKQYFV